MADPSSTKAAKRASIASISTISSTSSTSSASITSPHQQHSPLLPRRESSVQLIPHSHTPTYFDQPLTPSEQALVAATESSFSDLDLSSQDFDFDDVFTFDRPHRKIPRVVEVSTPSRDHHHHRNAATQQQRDWSNFSFSHYGGAVNARVKANANQHHHRLRPGVAGMQRELGLGIGAAYLRNQQLQQNKRR